MAQSVTLAPNEVASIVMYTILQSQAGGLRKGSESNLVCREEIFKYVDSSWDSQKIPENSDLGPVA